MTQEFPYIKKNARPGFRLVFNKILWDKNLSYGAKIFAFSLLTIPPQSNVKLKRLAAKLGTYSSALSRWRTELLKAKLTIRGLTPVESPKE